MRHHCEVAAVRNDCHDRVAIQRALEHLLDRLPVPLPALIKRGDRALVKVNMGCSGARTPEKRLTSHPNYVEAIIAALLDCGAVVSFGDDISRAGRHSAHIWEATGMAAVAKRTGAALIDFVGAGAREVRGSLLYPRSYLITNAYFEADVVINAASCRSHVGIGLSGAMQNMFGCVVGSRKRSLHHTFAGNERGFGRAIADICRLVRPDLSFLDLTSVAEGAGVTMAVRPVGLILAGADFVALDTVAAHTIGYEVVPVWAAYYAAKAGLGCDALEHIEIRGVDWASFPKPRLQPPLASKGKMSAYDRFSAVISNTALRPRPSIASQRCSGCGDCAQRCPLHAIRASSANRYSIDRRKCADCGCCVHECQEDAIALEFGRVPKAIRFLVHQSLRRFRTGAVVCDPAPNK